jgi:myo-inositol-1(or 4)-monophosphatase
MSNATAPELNFPLEEIQARVNFIEEKIGFIIDSVKRIQQDLAISSTLTDAEEKHLLGQVERNVHDALMKVITKVFPDDSVSSEEEHRQHGKNNFTWVLDPIDGSMNFLRKLPLYAISIGIQHRDSNVAGVVIVPELNDVYKAILGQGVTKNLSRIKVSEIQLLDRALLISSFPVNRKVILHEILADLSAFLTSGRSIRRTGSIVLDLCWLAEGRIDGLWEKRVGLWDLSAVSVILKEAGATISDYKGDQMITYPSDIVISNGFIHNQILEVLKKARQELSLN